MAPVVLLSRSPALRRMRRALFCCAVLPAVAAPALAQVPPVSLLGGASQANGSELVVLGHCSPPVSLCSPSNVIPQGALGGTAYDPVNGLFWHSNGSSLESALNWSCDFPCFGQSPVANTSGLAFDATTSSLWILGLLPELVQCRVPRDGTCPPEQGRCSLAGVIPAGTVAAGLALSEKYGLLFYSASRGGNAAINLILVAPLATPCQPICRLDLGQAFGPAQPDPITGLAFDDGTDELYAAAGSAGIAKVRLGFPGCTVGPAALCVPPGGYRFHGLCLQPPPPVVLGRSCAAAPCPTSCSTRLRANDATLGNHGFAFTIGSAPAGSVAIPVLGLGPCGAGVPGLCGAFFPQLPRILVLPAMVLSGPSTCTGGGVLPLPLPADPALHGAQLCVQALLVCSSGGLALTNALAVQITGG